VLWSWRGNGDKPITCAEFVARDSDLSGGPYAIIGYLPAPGPQPRSQFALYDLSGNRARPVRVFALTNDDVPVAEIKRRRGDDGRRFPGSAFGADQAILADVFADRDAVARRELVAVFKHEAVTHSAICIFHLDGALLYRVWVDADIEQLFWLAKPRLIVCAGVNGEASIAERQREQEEVTSTPTGHPLVVFAIRPTAGTITDNYVAQEPAERVAAGPELCPAWYYCVHPLSRRGIAGFVAGKALLAPETGDDCDNSVLVSVQLELPSQLGQHRPSRSWTITGSEGRVRDGPRGDGNKLFEQSPDEPDNPLPPYDSWRLGELPRKKQPSQSP
jgi:hypothetical protein